VATSAKTSLQLQTTVKPVQTTRATATTAYFLAYLLTDIIIAIVNS